MNQEGARLSRGGSRVGLHNTARPRGKRPGQERRELLDDLQPPSQDRPLTRGNPRGVNTPMKFPGTSGGVEFDRIPHQERFAKRQTPNQLAQEADVGNTIHRVSRNQLWPLMALPPGSEIRIRLPFLQEGKAPIKPRKTASSHNSNFVRFSSKPRSRGNREKADISVRPIAAGGDGREVIKISLQRGPRYRLNQAVRICGTTL